MKNIKEKIVEDHFETDALFVACPVSMDGKFKSPFNKEIAKKYRGVMNKYTRLYKSDLLQIGQCWKVKALDEKGKPVYILLMVTHKTYNAPSKPANVFKAVHNLRNRYRDMVITSLAIPTEHFGVFKGDHKKTGKIFRDELKDLIVQITLMRKIK